MDGLTDDYRVAVHIYNKNKANDPIWFSKLTTELEQEIDRDRLSQIVDKLFDLGIISGTWMKSDNGKWVRTFKITEDFQQLIQTIAE